MKVKLSVVIITYNEEKNIGRCLDSLKDVADEIIVVDSHSTDRTREICLEYGCRVVEKAFKGHIQQKNFALTQANYSHVLSLDADEVLSEELRNSILSVKNNWTGKGYHFNRLSSYSGKFVRHGSWYPDRKLRLFDSRLGRWGGANPHDKFIMPGVKSQFIKGDLLHYTYNSISEHGARINHFSDIAAKAAFENGKRFNILHVLVKPFWRFFRDYIIKHGFLAGYRGLAISILSATETFLKYIKLWEIEKNTPSILNNRKIIHICAESSWRGGEQQLAYLIEELNDLDVQNVVICKSGSAFERYCLFNSIVFHSLPFINSVDLYTSVKIKQICQMENASVMHLHSSKAHNMAFFAYLFGNRTPLVVSRKVMFPVKKNWFTKWKYKTSVVKKIICVSDAIRDSLNQQLGLDQKLVTVHDGIDISRFDIEGNGQEVRQRYGIPHDAFLTINISSLSSEKNVLTFIKAAEIIIRENPSSHFMCVGDGAERTMLEHYVMEQNLQKQIHFSGFIANIPEVLTAADALVLSSSLEGLGTSIIDAFASKVPVVASRVGGIPELVIDGETGILAQPGNAQSFADGLSRIMKNPELREEIKSKAYEHCLSFSKQQMGLKTLKIYQSITQR